MTKLIVVPKLGDMPGSGIFGDKRTKEEALEWAKSYNAESVVVFQRRDGKSVLAALVFKKKGKGNG
jgi:hypothetical protein